MTLRKTLAAAVALPLVCGLATADAAVKKPPKPVCLLVKDKIGDATAGLVPGVDMPNDPSLDIVSADIATNATTLTVWFRMSAMKAITDGDTANSSQTGRGYDVAVQVGAGEFKSFRAIVTNNDATTAQWPGGGTGKIDVTKKEIHFSVPIAALAAMPKAKEKINAKVTTWRQAATASGGNVDTAVGAPYVHMTSSCVKVGS